MQEITNDASPWLDYYTSDCNSSELLDELHCLQNEDFLPEGLTPALKITLALFFSFLSVGAIFGNVCVLIVILINRSLRSVTNTFIMSLVFSDTIIAAWNMPLQLLFYLKNEWTFGEALCKITSFIQGVSILTSILTLSAIAIERYHVICNPIKARYIRSTKMALMTLMTIWTTAVFVMLPQLWIQRLQPRLALQRERYPVIRIVYLCVEYFPKFTFNVLYTYGFFIIFYLLPVALMSYAYGHMARVLWVRTHIGESIVPPQISDKREIQKRNIIRMLIIIVMCFSICWLPFFSMHIITLYFKLTLRMRICQAFSLLFGYSNSFLNPFIYYFLNAKFNRVFRKTIRRVCCTIKKQSVLRHGKPTTQTTSA